MTADPILDQLAARWRDMDTHERRCCALHASTMRATLLVAKITGDELAKHPQFGGFTIVMDPAQLAVLVELQAELAEAGAVFKHHTLALVKHFADGDLAVATTLVDALLAEFHRRNPPELIVKLAARAWERADD